MAFVPAIRATLACKVFAARRVDDPNPDSWQMPQGGIDPGEVAQVAAVRVSRLQLLVFWASELTSTRV